MREFILPNRKLTSNDVFVIAEIGSNHMGDKILCERMIIEAYKCGVDAVKMQKRNNKLMFMESAYNKPYENELSYGKTYGEHREHLDWFGLDEFIRFKRLSESLGMIFFATPFEEESANFLNDLGIGMFKIASCDITNIPLIKQVAKFNKPMIFSTGGCNLDELKIIKELNIDNYALLHCISTYPNIDEQLNLQTIITLRNNFPNQLVGFSSHHPGLLPIYIARMMGANIFEVHFTLNRGFRGTDHGFSVEPAGLTKICSDLKRIKIMIGTGEKTLKDYEKGGFISKMGKGLYLKRPKKAGEIIKKSDIIIKSPYKDGLKPYSIDKIIGKMFIFDKNTDSPLRLEDFNV